MSDLGGGGGGAVQNLGNGCSIVLKNQVVLNFDSRHGAKISGHLDHLLQSYGKIYISIYFDRFYEKLRSSGFLQARCKYFCGGFAVCTELRLAFGGNWGERRNHLNKRFLSDNVIFRGLRLSLGHFG